MKKQKKTPQGPRKTLKIPCEIKYNTGKTYKNMKKLVKYIMK